jgi:broad specificity phosphatase PhoE
MISIYLIRHGAIRQFEPRRFIGQQDLPLTEEGRLQVGRLADFLADKAISRVVTSPLTRCRESADILWTKLGCSAPRVVADLREISLGVWEGLTVAQVCRRFPGDYQARGQNPLAFRPPLGESFADLADRVWPAFQEVTAACDDDSNVCIVAHAGVNRVVLCRILGRPPSHLFQLQQDYGCVNILNLDKAGYRVATCNFHP